MISKFQLMGCYLIGLLEYKTETFLVYPLPTRFQLPEIQNQTS